MGTLDSPDRAERLSVGHLEGVGLIPHCAVLNSISALRKLTVTNLTSVRFVNNFGHRKSKILLDLS